MPELTKPFQLVERKLTKVELVAAVRQAIIAEHDATAQYTLQAEAADDPYVKQVLLSIADEERVHVGELTTLLQYLTKDEDDKMSEGREEALDMAKSQLPAEEGPAEGDE